MSPLAEGSFPEEEPVASAPEVPEAPSAPGSPGSPGSPDVAQATGPAEPVEPVEPAVGGQEEKRRYPSTIGGVFYLLILGVMIAGLAIVGSGHWRGGVHWLAGALVVGAVLRFLLPQRDAGMLAVRARWIDVTMLGSLGVLLWVLASKTPNA